MPLQSNRPLAPFDQRRGAALLCALVSAQLISGCAAFRRQDAETTAADAQQASADAPQSNSKSDAEQLAELREKVTSMQSRIDTLEGRLAATRNGPRGEAVLDHPSQGVGESVNPMTAARDPEAGFINDEAVQAFRKGMILFQAGKYPEAALSFSSFVERFPDHPLAGSAQFHLGESFFRQRDYSSALKEFSRVPTSYDRSSHVSHALARMALSEQALKKPREAARHRELLSALFPQSPATQLAEGGEPAAARTNTVSEDASGAATASPANDGFDPPPTAPIGAGTGSPVRAAPEAPAVKEIPLTAPGSNPANALDEPPSESPSVE